MTNKEKLSRLTIDLTQEDHKKLKSIAAIVGKSMRDIVLEAVERYLHDLEATDNNIRLPKGFNLKKD